MFFWTKTIKGTPLVQLVQSYRNAEGQPRQRVVASLGDAKLPEGEERQIAQAVERRLQGNRDWFDDVSLSGSMMSLCRKTQLRGREKDLFSLSRSVILYEVTNTHFEGLCRKNPKARHGKNKQKRNDCRQVAVGVAFDEHGLPLAHEVFEGNIADTKTLVTLLDRLEIKDDGLKPVVILDAGFALKQNMALLKETAMMKKWRPRWASAATMF